MGLGGPLRLLREWLAGSFGFYFLLADAGLQLEQFHLQIAEVFAVRAEGCNALFAQLFLKYRNL